MHHIEYILREKKKIEKKLIILKKITKKGMTTKNLIEFTPELIDEATIIDLANTLDNQNFFNLLEYLSSAYHNDESLISDKIFDELVDIYEAKYQPYTKIGADPTREKIKLPYYLGSLRKIKQSRDLELWIKSYKGPYIIEDKIDGLTLLFVHSDTEDKLYTRGRGVYGVDVSHLLPYLRFPLKNLQDPIAIRGEIVMTKNNFLKYGTEFKNARNLVSGIVNSKKSFNQELANHLSFYAYRIINYEATPEEQVSYLSSIGFLTPYVATSDEINIEILKNHLDERKKTSDYEMDGLVVYQNIAVEYPVGENPKHVVAFKTESISAETMVTEVEWNTSKNGLLKPTILYDPVNLSGAKLSRTTGYNGRYIVNNKIGPGAKILITRSGDVIPKIISILSPAPKGPGFPDPSLLGEYEWDKNGVEFILTEKEQINNPDMKILRMLNFVEKIEIKNFGKKRIESLYHSGIMDLDSLLRITPKQLSDIPGLGPILSSNFYQDLNDKIKDIKLSTLLVASGFFPHIGEKRFDIIIDQYPNFLEIASTTPEKLYSNIQGIKGFDQALTTIIVNVGHVSPEEFKI